MLKNKKTQGKGFLYGSLAATATVIAGVLNKKSIGKMFKSLTKRIKNIENDNRLMDVSTLNGFNTEALAKENFLKNFVEGVKHPFDIVGEGKNQKREMKHIPNGLMLTGPDSNVKEDRFNWMLQELQNAGAEIIDPGNGKKLNLKRLMILGGKCGIIIMMRNSKRVASIEFCRKRG